MEFRRLTEKRAVQRPEIDPDDDLAAPAPHLKGELYVDGARYDGDDYANTTGDGEISHALLDHVNLSETTWEPVTLANVRITHADLSNATWAKAGARRVEVLDSRGTGWRLLLDFASDLYIADTRLDYAAVHLTRTKGLVVFERCTFPRARIGGDLTNTVFLDCDLTTAEFTATTARGCDLRTSTLAGLRGLATLTGARVTEDQALSMAGQLAAELGLTVTESPTAETD